MGLVYLHRHNIIHRDLKCENILMVSAIESSDHPSADSRPDGITSSMSKEFGAVSSLEEGVNEDNSSSSVVRTSCSMLSWEEFADLHPQPSEEDGSSLPPLLGPSNNIDGQWKLRGRLPRTGSTLTTESTANCCCRNCSVCQSLQSLLDVKISDFGLSKILAPSGVALEQLGTLHYAAPEVILGQPYGQAVDLWSLGVVIYHVLCGVLPFDGIDDSAVAEAVVLGVYQFRPLEYWDSVSPEAKVVVVL